jgi:hypothetical protein
VITSPRNDRNWTPDVNRSLRPPRRQPFIIINVRNFQYRSDTDFIQNWETRTYDLSHLRGVDMLLFLGTDCHARTTRADFGDGQHVAISTDARGRRANRSALLGFFLGYEYYVVADERDVIGVHQSARRAGLRRRIRLPRRSRSGAILLDYLAEVNALSTTRAGTMRRRRTAPPPFANTFTRHAGAAVELEDPCQRLHRRFRYERGIIDNTLPFAEMKQQQCHRAGKRPAPVRILTHPRGATEQRNDLDGIDAIYRIRLA